MENAGKEEYLYIDRLLFPVTSLGPGNRLAIWVSGCKRGCFRCANPELWERKESQRIEKKRFAEILEQLFKGKDIDGITISGGEPMDQALILADILKQLKNKNICPEDILSFTGYSLEEVYRDENKAELARQLAVIIDGPYVDELNDGVSALQGSSNQRITYLKEGFRLSYEEYIKKGRQIQNFVYEYEILSVGIHKGEQNGKD